MVQMLWQGKGWFSLHWMIAWTSAGTWTVSRSRPKFIQNMCFRTLVCTSVNLTCLCSAWNYACAYTHKCLSHVFQCYDDKIWFVTQQCLIKNMFKNFFKSNITMHILHRLLLSRLKLIPHHQQYFYDTLPRTQDTRKCPSHSAYYLPIEHLMTLNFKFSCTLNYLK